MALVKTKMELGFVEKVDDPSQLCNSLFPSKVGGKPAWLDPQDLPPPESVSCKRCRSPLTFLLQVYAPLSDGERDETFHRSISIFMCRDSICHQQDGPKCFQVLRCQLRKVNNFYSESADSTVDTADQLDRLKLDEVDDPQDDDTDDKPLISATEMTVQDIEGWDEEVKSKPASTSSVSVEGTLTVCRRTSPLCIVCGMSGPKSCAKCKRVSYCSKEHQTHDWKNGHKLFCPDLAKGNNCIVDYDPSVGVTLPLFEIVTEPEPENASPDGRAEKSVEERMADYHSIVKTKNLSVSRLKKEESVREKKSDKQFKVFKKRVALEPEQVGLVLCCCLLTCVFMYLNRSS